MIWLDIVEGEAWEDDWDYECLFCGGERRPIRVRRVRRGSSRLDKDFVT